MQLHRLALRLTLLVLLAPLARVGAQSPPPQAPQVVHPQLLFAAVLSNLVTLIEPPKDAEPWELSTRIEIVRAKGLPKMLENAAAEFAFQAPARLKVSGRFDKRELAAGRDGSELWIYAPEKKFGVVGRPGVARFASAPDKLDETHIEPFRLPIGRTQVFMLPLLCAAWLEGAQTVDGASCHVLNVLPYPQTANAIKLPNFNLRLWVRQSDNWPVRLAYRDGDAVDLEVNFKNLKVTGLWPTVKWQLPARAGDHIETVAVSHVTRFFGAAWKIATEKIPTLGPATGERRLVAKEGKGRLEDIDGTRVLYLEGTPEEMGAQQGKLLQAQVKDLVERVLYGVGVGTSFEKARWFFGEIEQAQARLLPHADARHLREMDALALASGCEREEMRLANFFPELFHCSGFALFGAATVDGKLYHGRILDYMKGVGLEQNAVVTVVKPDKGNAWVNVGYAGFIGSVTAMNEKHVAIGEMGGKGEGNWDGKPMAQLVREVMEKANTLEEAVEIMRRGPRTCEYFYVISDAKTKRAIGIAATPEKFDTVRPGEVHPELRLAVKDTVLMSGGDRYQELARRVKAGFGKFDAAGARDLMTRPVCMPSNIHSVLFEPESLDFWVANADSTNPASHTRYTRYNLGELLKGPPKLSGAPDQPPTVAVGGR